MPCSGISKELLSVTQSSTPSMLSRSSAAIDRSNQDRTDMVEEIDTYFREKYADVTPAPDATINTESPAWALDRLSILALKIYHMAREVERTDASPEHIAKCQAKLDILLQQEQDLTTAIDQLLD